MSEQNSQNSGDSKQSRRRRARTRSKSGKRSVPLHRRSTSHFQRADRERGNEYFLEGRVDLEVEGTRARARVQGTEQPAYAVGLDWSQVGERILHTFCECPRFSGGRPCKHVWATLLALADSDLEQQPPGTDRLSVRKDRPNRWRDLGVSANGGDSPGPQAPASPPPSIATARRSGSWRAQVAFLSGEAERLTKARQPPEKTAEDDDEYRFLINTTASRTMGGLVLDVFRGDPDKNLKRARLEPDELAAALLPAGNGLDRLSVVSSLPLDRPSNRQKGRRPKNRSLSNATPRLRLPSELMPTVLPYLCEREALGWWDGRPRSRKQWVEMDEGTPWNLALRLEDASGGSTRVRGVLERDGDTEPLRRALLVVPRAMCDDEAEDHTPSFVLFPTTLARLDLEPHRDLPWIALLRDSGEIVIPKQELEEALTAIFQMPDLPPLETIDGLQLQKLSSDFTPHLLLEPDATAVAADPPLLADLSFDYDGVGVSAGDPRTCIVDWDEQTFLQRDMEAERESLVHLLDAGLQPVASGHGDGLELPPGELATVAEQLLEDGWTVEVRGRSLHAPNPPSLKVESGIDWFELSGSMDFRGNRVELREILEAIKKGNSFVELEDGGRGLLPAEWVQAWGSLADLAQESSEEGLRFLPSQTLLVDALLAQTPTIDVDGTFAELREKLSSFEKVKPKKEPRGFKGTLREYQRQGLGWLTFLREFGLGGVLADDMGLGKTVQVLALLRANRTPQTTTGLPSLVVAPRSLVYNWIDEAARFTPTLKVVEYSGPDREAVLEKLDRYDIVVTTYGTLRRDIPLLSKVEFDTAILDEAQAIKNRTSQAAKACRLLKARHRLALTGTPIENHLGELGSIFEFLNPGLLGRLPQLELLATGRPASKQELALVQKGMRPFILRRTKAQVLQDLPPKTEQVLFCDLRPEQREIYDKLRSAYQASLLQEVETKGVSGAAIQVLEALLRLRQVACHPGLVDESWEKAGSAKLEALFEHVFEVLEEGHKLLIFSQFTKLLGFVRRHLDEQGVIYAYLDGQTRNRGEVVETFQTDPDCNLFLMSLKAGGVGLNLTAAGYVFLLDPWWNPAVEAQAIDRAHRIGQTQPVFSYRLIARDTVEEKILDLQRTKKQLAESILDGGDESPLKQLTADDLRRLLS